MGWFKLAGWLGVPRYIWALLVIAALAAVVIWWTQAEKADDKANQTIGAQGAVIEGQQTTLEQIGEANDAGNDIRADRDSAKFDECVRSAAEGYAGYCERYRPVEPVPDR